jgi:hypothetical protein
MPASIVFPQAHVISDRQIHPRGVVHFHAVIRLDSPGAAYQPPPGWKRSLDERLVGCEQGRDLDGYVPGAK